VSYMSELNIHQQNKERDMETDRDKLGRVLNSHIKNGHAIELEDDIIRWYTKKRCGSLPKKLDIYDKCDEYSYNWALTDAHKLCGQDGGDSCPNKTK